MCFPCFSLVNASRESRATATTTTTSKIIFPNVFLLAPISLDLRSLPRPHSTTRDPDPNVCFEIIRPMEDLFKKTGSKTNLVELIEELDLLRWRIDNHHITGLGSNTYKAPLVIELAWSSKKYPLLKLTVRTWNTDRFGSDGFPFGFRPPDRCELLVSFRECSKTWLIGIFIFPSMNMCHGICK